MHAFFFITDLNRGYTKINRMTTNILTSCDSNSSYNLITSNGKYYKIQSTLRYNKNNETIRLKKMMYF